MCLSMDDAQYHLQDDTQPDRCLREQLAEEFHSH